MRLYTIGYAGKDARTFFGMLAGNGVRTLVDVRLANTSQLAAYTKKPDLEYFLDAIAGIRYIHATWFAPTAALMEGVKTRVLSRTAFESGFRALLAERNPGPSIRIEDYEDACLLCSESRAEDCHRRLVAEYLAERRPGLEVVHL